MKMGLVAKLILLFAAIIVVLSISLALLFLSHEKHLIENDVFEKVSILARNTANNSEYYLLIGDNKKMEDLLKKLVKIHDIVYAELKMENGKIFSKAGKFDSNNFHEVSCDVMTLVSPEEKEIFETLSEKDTEKKKKIGTLYIDYSLLNAQRKLSKIKQQTSQATLLAILFACLAAYLGVKNYTLTPLKHLMTGIKIIGSQNLDYKIKLNTSDEIGQLAKAFNQMTDKLSSTLISKEYVTSIINSMNEAIMVISPTGKIKRINPAALRLYGFQKQEELLEHVLCLEQNENEETIISIDSGNNLTKQIPLQEMILFNSSNEKLFILFSASKMTNYKFEAFDFVCVLQDITVRKMSEIQIKNNLIEKEVLLKEIHHRVKNNMQVISSLLSLQSNYLKDKQAINMIKDSQNRVDVMMRIHEKLYQSIDLAHIDFGEYLRNLTEDLLSSYYLYSTETKIDIQVGSIFLNVNKAIPCGLIVNELITNSLKYAYPKGKKGKIYISLSPVNDEKLKLIVSDNGVGLPEDVNFEKTDSLGLQLIVILTKQLKGTIELNKENGTSFTIIFEKE